MQLNICCIEICSWRSPVISFFNCLHCAGEHCLLTIDSDVIVECLYLVSLRVYKTFCQKPFFISPCVCSHLCLSVHSLISITITLLVIKEVKHCWACLVLGLYAAKHMLYWDLQLESSRDIIFKLFTLCWWTLFTCYRFWRHSGAFFFYKPCSCLSGYPLFFPFASS